MTKELLLRCIVCNAHVCTSGYDEDPAKALAHANELHSRHGCPFNLHQVEVIEIEEDGCEEPE